jgi:hypothetical protein
MSRDAHHGHSSAAAAIFVRQLEQRYTPHAAAHAPIASVDADQIGIRNRIGKPKSDGKKRPPQYAKANAHPAPCATPKVRAR